MVVERKKLQTIGLKFDVVSGNGRIFTGGAGSTIKKSAPPMASTVPGPVPGMSMLKMASWFGKLRIRIIRIADKVIPTTNPVVVPGEPPIRGTPTVRFG